MKKELLAVGISAVLVLVVFTSGCIDFGGEEKKKDTTAPIISEVSASSITSSGATITWTTNETSSSVVEYGTTTGYGSTATGTDDVTSHSVTLSGLSSGTTYHYGVKSADSSGNTATLGDYTFTTLSTEQPPIITMLELMDDYNPNTWSFKTYEPGTAVNIYDTVVNVSCVSTSYGEFTMVFFNWDSEEVPVAVEGNKTSEYPVGEAVTVYTPINEYNISGKKMTFFGYYEYFMYIYVSGFMTVYGGILLNSRFASSGNEKLVVATTDLYDSGYLDEYSVVLEKETFTDEVFSSNVSKSTVDNISSLTGWVTSSGEHITFRDANSNGFLDSGDCFIISLGNTSSEYIMDSYTLTLKRGEENETSAGLVLGYKGLFYSETYNEPMEPVYAIAMASWNQVSGEYNATSMVIAMSTGGGIKWSDITWVLYNVSTGAIETGAVFIHYSDVDADGYLDTGDVVKVTTGKAGTFKVRIIVGGSLIYESSPFTIVESIVSISITYYKDDGTKDDDGSKLDPKFSIGVDWEKDGWYTMYSSQIYYNTSEIQNPYSVTCKYLGTVSSVYVQIDVLESGQNTIYGIDINSAAGGGEYKLEYYLGNTVNIYSNGEDDGEFPGAGGHDAEIYFTITSPGAQPAPANASRVVLAECFTGTWCSPCQGADGALDRLADEYPRTQLVILEWHDNDDYSPPDNSYIARENYYSITGFPSTWFDGVELAYGGSTNPDDTTTYNNYKQKIDMRLAISSNLTINIEGVLGDTIGTINASITALGPVTLSNLKARFVIYEDHQETVYVSGREYRLRYTVVNGTIEAPVSISEGQTVVFNKTFTIDSNWNRSKLGVVVFIQSDTTKEVLQTGVYNFIPAKNSRSVTPTSAPTTSISSAESFSAKIIQPQNTFLSSATTTGVEWKIYDYCGKKIGE